MVSEPILARLLDHPLWDRYQTILTYKSHTRVNRIPILSRRNAWREWDRGLPNPNLI